MDNPGYEINYDEQFTQSPPPYQSNYTPTPVTQDMQQLPEAAGGGQYDPAFTTNQPVPLSAINTQTSVSMNNPPVAISTGYQQPGEISKQQYADYGQPPTYYPPVAPVYPQTIQAFHNAEVIGVQPVGYAPGTIIVQQTYVRRPPSYMCYSCCTFWFINFIFGAIAFGFSMASYMAIGDGKFERARSHGKIALYLNLIGLIVTSIIITVLVFMAI